MSRCTCSPEPSDAAHIGIPGACAQLCGSPCPTVSGGPRVKTTSPIRQGLDRNELGHVWGHLWLSRLQERELLALSGWGQGHCSAPRSTQDAHSDHTELSRTSAKC